MPQDTGEPIGQAGGTPGKMYLRKDRKKHHTERATRDKKKKNRHLWTKLVWTPRSEKDSKDEQALVQRFSIAYEGPQWSIYPHCNPWSMPLWSTGKVWGGTNSSDRLLWTNHKRPSPPLCIHQGQGSWGIQSEGLKQSIGKGGQRCCFNFVFCFSPSNSILPGSKLINYCAPSWACFAMMVISK